MKYISLLLSMFLFCVTVNAAVTNEFDVIKANTYIGVSGGSGNASTNTVGLQTWSLSLTNQFDGVVKTSEFWMSTLYDSSGVSWMSSDRYIWDTSGRRRYDMNNQTIYNENGQALMIATLANQDLRNNGTKVLDWKTQRLSVAWTADSDFTVGGSFIYSKGLTRSVTNNGVGVTNIEVFSSGTLTNLIHNP